MDVRPADPTGMNFDESFPILRAGCWNLPNFDGLLPGKDSSLHILSLTTKGVIQNLKPETCCRRFLQVICHGKSMPGNLGSGSVITLMQAGSPLLKARSMAPLISSVRSTNSPYPPIA